MESFLLNYILQDSETTDEKFILFRTPNQKINIESLIILPLLFPPLFLDTFKLNEASRSFFLPYSKHCIHKINVILHLGNTNMNKWHKIRVLQACKNNQPLPLSPI